MCGHLSQSASFAPLYPRHLLSFGSGLCTYVWHGCSTLEFGCAQQLVTASVTGGLWCSRHYEVRVAGQVDLSTGLISCVFGGCIIGSFLTVRWLHKLKLGLPVWFINWVSCDCITRFLAVDHAAFARLGGVVRWTPGWVILVRRQLFPYKAAAVYATNSCCKRHCIVSWCFFGTARVGECCYGMPGEIVQWCCQGKAGFLRG